MSKEKYKKYSNTPMDDDLFNKLNKMAPDNRAAFVRRLIDQEWNRRHPEEVKDAEAEEQERCNE